MRKAKKILVVSVAAIFVLPLMLLVASFAIGTCLYLTADFLQPDVEIDTGKYELSLNQDSLKVCNRSSLQLNKHGLWEAHIVGNPVELGATYGVLCKDLLRYQEDVFVNRINEMIPSEMWVNFLHKLIIVFNRNMAPYIPEEYRREIYAISRSCTDAYNMYGSPYIRQLNYHAAHDIGHAMQEYMLVGCSSFACWGEESESKELIVGRNFDFYVGDDFAKNKMVLFVEPEKGYRFASISWPGMMGVLSGMNEKGLTVTINASKGAIPTSSAMPISLLARHILQYASNIEEAYGIALQFKTFVSESILIGSANDGCAAIIEKTTDMTDIYRGRKSRVICTNHYQSSAFVDDPYNLDNIATTDSPYRYERINELLNECSPLTPNEAVAILRNRYGQNNTDIGLSNEKSINQFIAHHSVVFEPSELRFWVSTSPWQLGGYVCYDLNEVFDTPRTYGQSYSLEQLNIAPDNLAMENEYVRVCRYREQYRAITTAIEEGSSVSTECKEVFIENNPHYFQVYNTLGDYEESRGDYKQAVVYWNKALSLEIPRTPERDDIISKIKRYDQR